MVTAVRQRPVLRAGHPLRIAQIAPIAAAVSPRTGRSIEKVVSLLTEGLVARGHQVTLFATRDSETSAGLEGRYAQGYQSEAALWDWTFHETLHAGHAFARADRFDVIHAHNYHYALPFAGLTTVPVVITSHMLADEQVVAALADGPAHAVALSDYQATQMASVARLTVIANGLEVDSFPQPGVAGGYLLYLGVVSRRKGARDAIEIARRAGRPLVIAGPWGDARALVEPLVDGDQVRYVGSVGVAQRNSLLAGADALLYPITEPEAFGLVLIEAMACGTPVVARSLGAVPELVEPGVTGHHAPTNAAMAALVDQAAPLPRATIRERAGRFSHQRMVDEYDALYHALAGQRSVAR